MDSVLKDAQAKLSVIDQYAAQQEEDRTGLTERKNAARVKLVDSILPVSGHLASFAKRTGDSDLRQRASQSRSDWMKGPQGKVAERAKGIFNLAKENREALVEFGLTDASLAKLEREIGNWEATLALPRDLIIRRKTITGLVAAEIQGLGELLREELDPLIAQFESTHPKFYANYHHARALVDLPVIPRAKREASRQAAAAKKAAKVKAKAERQAAAPTQGIAELDA